MSCGERGPARLPQNGGEGSPLGSLFSRRPCAFHPRLTSMPRMVESKRSRSWSSGASRVYGRPGGGQVGAGVCGGTPGCRQPHPCRGRWLGGPSGGGLTLSCSGLSSSLLSSSIVISSSSSSTIRLSLGEKGGKWRVEEPLQDSPLTAPVPTLVPLWCPPRAPLPSLTGSPHCAGGTGSCCRRRG